MLYRTVVIAVPVSRTHSYTPASMKAIIDMNKLPLIATTELTGRLLSLDILQESEFTSLGLIKLQGSRTLIPAVTVSVLSTDDWLTPGTTEVNASMMQELIKQEET